MDSGAMFDDRSAGRWILIRTLPFHHSGFATQHLTGRDLISGLRTVSGHFQKPLPYPSPASTALAATSINVPRTIHVYIQINHPIPAKKVFASCRFQAVVLELRSVLPVLEATTGGRLS